MKANLLALLVAIGGLAAVASAQTMVEYSNLSTHSAGRLAASSARGRKSVDHYGATKHGLWQEKGARLKDQNPSKPAPPAVFILTSGERLETSNYFLTTDSLRIDQDDKQRTIPLSVVNVNATVAANHQRGLDLKIPANKAQITLGF